MKNIKLLVITFSILLFSCENDDQLTKEEETHNLTTMYDEIITTSMVNTTPCTNPKEWSFTVIDSKLCEGTAAFIPYSLKINFPEFLKKIDNYNNAKKAYAEKWGTMLSCYMTRPPSGIDCVDGKPILIYSIPN
jgi:hypothetical protein